MGHCCRSASAFSEHASSLIELDAQLLLALPQLEFLVLQGADLLGKRVDLVKKLAFLLLQELQNVGGVGGARSISIVCGCALKRGHVLSPAKNIDIMEAATCALNLSRATWSIFATECAHWIEIVKVVRGRCLHIRTGFYRICRYPIVSPRSRLLLMLIISTGRRVQTPMPGP